MRVLAHFPRQTLLLPRRGVTARVATARPRPVAEVLEGPRAWRWRGRGGGSGAPLSGQESAHRMHQPPPAERQARRYARGLKAGHGELFLGF